MRKFRLSALVIGCALVASLAIPASALETTTTEILSTMANDTMQPAVVRVDPQPSAGSIKGKYFRKTASGWKLLEKGRADSMGPGLYVLEFDKTSKGKVCKIVAAFTGDDAYAASKDVVKIACKTGFAK